MENTAEERGTEGEMRLLLAYLLWLSLGDARLGLASCNTVILCICDISSYRYIMIIIGNGGSIRSKIRR